MNNFIDNLMQSWAKNIIVNTVALWIRVNNKQPNY